VTRKDFQILSTYTTPLFRGKMSYIVHTSISLVLKTIPLSLMYSVNEMLEF